MRNILVTGAGGLIGKSFIEELRKNKDDKVLGLLHKGSFSNIEQPYIFDDVRTFESKEKFDLVYHLASKKDLLWCENNLKEAYDINVNGTKNLLKLNYSKFFYMSSEMADEGNGYATTFYGLTKRAAEILIQEKDDIDGSNIEYFIIRCGLVFPERVLWVDKAVLQKVSLAFYKDRYREYVPLKKCIEALVSLANPLLERKRNTIVGRIHGKFQSQLAWGIEYLDRTGQLEKAIVRPISRLSSVHGSFGEKGAIKVT